MFDLMVESEFVGIVWPTIISLEQVKSKQAEVEEE